MYSKVRYIAHRNHPQCYLVKNCGVKIHISKIGKEWGKIFTKHHRFTTKRQIVRINEKNRTVKKMQ